MLKAMHLALTAGLLLAAGSALAAERTVVLDVQNVSCVTCGPIVEWAIGSLAGVTSVEVVEEVFGQAVATVIYDDELVAPEAFVQASTDAGYPAVVRIN
jgi:periplasmic mercuric ion binding protein